MGLNAGNLNRRVQVLRFTETGRNDLNEPVSDWQALGSPIPAQRRDVSDVERLAAGFVGTAAQSRFVIRDTAFARSILHTDCLQHEGIVWEIIGIKEVPPGRGFIEITASTGNRP